MNTKKKNNNNLVRWKYSNFHLCFALVKVLIFPLYSMKIFMIFTAKEYNPLFIIAGDWNFNMLSPISSRKIKAICEQFSLYQVIEEPTHYTEYSSSLLDTILTNNYDLLVMNGVGDTYLQQSLSYLCYFTICKTKTKIICAGFGDYNLLIEM